VCSQSRDVLSPENRQLRALDVLDYHARIAFANLEGCCFFRFSMMLFSAELKPLDSCSPIKAFEDKFRSRNDDPGVG
jgi:hypothetical protein